MANTTNLDLVKPAGTDYALVSVINSNSDKIDAFAGSANQANTQRPIINLGNTYTDNCGIVVCRRSVAISNGGGSVDISSFLPAGKSFISTVFALPVNTGTLAVTGVNVSGSTVTIKVSNTSASDNVDFNILAFCH